MKDTIQIKIQFFGAFKQFTKYFNDENHLTLQLQNPCTIADVRKEFNRQLKLHCSCYNEQLLTQSLFANHDSIIPDNALINASSLLCIIPPVSGG